MELCRGTLWTHNVEGFPDAAHDVLALLFAQRATQTSRSSIAIFVDGPVAFCRITFDLVTVHSTKAPWSEKLVRRSTSGPTVAFFQRRESRSLNANSFVCESHAAWWFTGQGARTVARRGRGLKHILKDQNLERSFLTNTTASTKPQQTQSNTSFQQNAENTKRKTPNVCTQPQNHQTQTLKNPEDLTSSRHENPKDPENPSKTLNTCTH